MIPRVVGPAAATPFRCCRSGRPVFNHERYLMPRKQDDPSVRTIGELRDEGPEAFAEAVKEAWPTIAPMLEGALSHAQNDWAEIEAIVRRLVPDFDGSRRSQCKLAGLLSKHYPGEPLDDWHQLPIHDLLGYVEAAATYEAKPAGIPHDKRTKPMTKAEALNYIGWPAGARSEREAREWLTRSIRDGEYRWEKINNKSGVYHLDDFKPECWEEIRAH